MTTSLHFETGSIADDVVRAMARVIIAPLLAVAWFLAMLVTHWRIVGSIAGIVGAVVVSVTWPLFPLGLGIVAFVGWLTYPRTVVRS